jgi:hypothetical protein
MAQALRQQFLNQDMSVEIISPVFELDRILNGFSVQAFFANKGAAVPTGVLQLEGSNMPSPGDNGEGGFSSIGAAYQLSVAAAGNQMFEYSDCNFACVRLHWLPSGGGGLLTSFWFARAF